MIPRQPVDKIFIATISPVKHHALYEVIDGLKSFYPGPTRVHGFDVQPHANPAQPVNSALQCAENRIQALREAVKATGVDIDSPEFIFISIESGIEIKEGQTPQDVCYVKGQRGAIGLHSFSYPIEVPQGHYQNWIASGIESHALGYTTTFGDFIATQIEGVDSKNWMAHEALGSRDRIAQIQDALSNLLGKFMIESKIAYYSDFPKPGVTFKDLSFVIGDPELLKILVISLLSNHLDEGDGVGNQGQRLG